MLKNTPSNACNEIDSLPCFFLFEIHEKQKLTFLHYNASTGEIYRRHVS